MYYIPYRDDIGQFKNGYLYTNLNSGEVVAICTNVAQWEFGSISHWGDRRCILINDMI